MVSDKLKRMVGKADQPIAPSIKSTLPLDQITDRPGRDTRDLNQTHVEALAESIAVLGLIQPIAVDIEGRLLAGGHRRAAIVHLQGTNPTAFSQWFGAGIPIHRFDFDASQDAGRALAIEATENEKRRDYTVEEVRALADRLEAAGFRRKGGRPKEGEKALAPMLAVIVGKSQRTVERYLANEIEKTPTDGGVSHDIALTQRALTKLLKNDDCPDDVRKAAEKLIKLLGK